MDFNDVLQLVSKFTVAQILERDDFKKRLQTGSDISIHEIMYPIMQAYDSVMLQADVEMGGTDQKFNLLAGRTLQKKIGQDPQEIMMTKLLVGTDGKEKMSKSLGNYIGIAESPENQFGKIMSLPDKLIEDYFILCTRLPMEEIKKELTLNPRDAKEALAYEVVKLYHGEKEATEARENFVKQFRHKEKPKNIPVVKVAGTYKIPLLLMNLKAVKSSSEAHRLIEQGGLRIDGAKITDSSAEITLKKGMIIQVGKLKYYKIN
jgi:tyrosyl-tRNA synthetase